VRGPTKGSKYFTEVSGKGLLRSAYIALRGLTYTARKESESVEPRQQGEYDTNYGYWRERTCISREEVLIAAPLDTVWRLHTDISSWSEWLPDIDTSTSEGSLRVETVFHWQTSGLTIESTIREVDPPQRIVWSVPPQGIMAIHVWTVTPSEDRVLVHTEEPWDGEPVRAQPE
jgi:Polyketide cyclase / dehydrase and lipid transport